jgi:epoxyqueuosine reductase QueG
MDTEKIRQRIIEWGANLVGFADLSEYVPAKINSLKNAVSIAVRLSDPIIDEVIQGPTLEYAYHHHVVSALLNEIALKTSNLIQSSGYKAFPVPVSQTTDRAMLSAAIPHKTAATRAGLGWVGKNSLLVTPEFGPRVRLVTVLSDYPFEWDSPVEESRCNTCNECVGICPLKAINGKNWRIGMGRGDLLDAELCSLLIEENRKFFDAPICGRCLSICPVGRRR